MPEMELNKFYSLLTRVHLNASFPWNEFLDLAQILLKEEQLGIGIAFENISVLFDLIHLEKDGSPIYPISKTEVIFKVLVEFEKKVQNNTTPERWGNRLLDYLINSGRGMIYLAMLELSDNWEKENPNLGYRWMPKIQEYFTQKIGEDGCNQELQLTLGKSINLLGWLNESWLMGNFEKIFPLEESPVAIQKWKFAFAGYLYSRGQVLKPVLALFCKYREVKSQNHFERAIEDTFDAFGEDSLVFHIWLMYLDDSSTQINPDSLIGKIITQGRENRISQIIYLYYRQRGKMDANTNLRKKLLPLWKALLKKILELRANSSIPFLLLRLSEWVELVDEVDQAVFQLLEESIQHFASLEAEMFFKTLASLRKISPEFLGGLSNLCSTKIEFPELIKPYRDEIDRKMNSLENKRRI